MIESKNTMSLLMVLVTFTWALSGIATKYLSFYVSENEIVVYRYFFATSHQLRETEAFKIHHKEYANNSQQ